MDSTVYFLIVIIRVIHEAFLDEFKEEADGVNALYKALQSQIELLQERTGGDKTQTLIELEELHFLSYQHFEIFGE